MKKSLFSISIATVLTLTSISSQAATDNLIYVAVDPCRVVDTRNAGGALTTTSRNFLVSGTSGQLAAQGGTADCLNPRAGVEPLAISAYVLAISPTGGTGGVLTAFPAGDPDPAVGAGSTVNFAAQQVIGNTTNITLCDPTGTCPSDGEFAILPRNSNQVHVVVDVQGYFYSPAGSCPDDMVAIGSLCVDKYEASVYDSAGSQLDTGVVISQCAADGSNCGDSAGTTATAIFARSVDGVTPNGAITWYQANQACANVGKRLPTAAEWQMAASGTDDTQCPNAALSTTGISPNCISTVGALDMVGNLWEWTADLEFSAGDTSTDDMDGRVLGWGYLSGPGGSTKSVFAPPPTATNLEFGFRCAR